MQGASVQILPGGIDSAQEAGQQTAARPSFLMERLPSVGHRKSMSAGAFFLRVHIKQISLPGIWTHTQMYTHTYMHVSYLSVYVFKMLEVFMLSGSYRYFSF